MWGPVQYLPSTCGKCQEGLAALPVLGGSRGDLGRSAAHASLSLRIDTAHVH